MAPNGGEFEVDFDRKERAVDEAPIGITLTDPERPDNPLVYVNDSFERLTGYTREEILGRNCRVLQGEDSDPGAVAAMRQAVENEEAVTVELVNHRADGEAFWNEVTIAPLTDEDGEVVNFVGFQTDVTARKEAEFEVERERRTLDHLLSRIEGLLGDVTRELVEARSRDEVETAVCERVVEAESYAFAWVGRVDLAAETLDPTAWAGAADGAVPASSVDLDGPHPAARAVASRAVEVRPYDEVTSGAGRQSEEDAASRADEGGEDGPFADVAAVPLAYGDTVYGAIVVYTSREDALDDRETAVLGTLGRATATAIHAQEGRRILSTDNVVELELSVSDRRLFFVDLSASADCRLEYRGSVRRSDGGTSMFFTVDADEASVRDWAETAPDVEAVSRVGGGDDGEGLFEFRVEEAVVSVLAEWGVRTRSITVDDGAARFRLELPLEGDSRTVVERVRDRYPETSVVAYRERERPPVTKAEFVDQVRSQLTDRQLAALQRAYLSGYYATDRTATGDDLAASMGISRATFHQHLRAAERKLLGEFFDQ